MRETPLQARAAGLVLLTAAERLLLEGPVRVRNQGCIAPGEEKLQRETDSRTSLSNQPRLSIRNLGNRVSDKPIPQSGLSLPSDRDNFTSRTRLPPACSPQQRQLFSPNSALSPVGTLFQPNLLDSKVLSLEGKTRPHQCQMHPAYRPGTDSSRLIF